MGNNSHSRLDRNIILGEQACEARMIWRAGRGRWLWDSPLASIWYCMDGIVLESPKGTDGSPLPSLPTHSLRPMNMPRNSFSGLRFPFFTSFELQAQ